MTMKACSSTFGPPFKSWLKPGGMARSVFMRTLLVLNIKNTITALECLATKHKGESPLTIAVLSSVAGDGNYYIITCSADARPVQSLLVDFL